MPLPNRSVDRAMDADRSAKQAIRDLWVEQAKHYKNNYPGGISPLYITLSGAEGRDIVLLAEHNIIKLTEVGGIAPESQSLVVAIENSPPAALKLQRRFPGLKIIEQDVKSLIKGDSLTRYPERGHEEICRARVVNLDLNCRLEVEDSGSGYVIPVINWIEKFCQIHKKTPRQDWCLCLTLHGEINWSSEVCNYIQLFLLDNFLLSSDFEHACRNVLGDVLVNTLKDETLIDFSGLTRDLQQKILMVFVPKKITNIVTVQGWKVSTTYNLHYGGENHTAPMVTWIIDFEGDRRTPNTVYIECINNILSSAGFIRTDGEITRYA